MNLVTLRPLAKKIVKANFKNDYGQAFDLTDGQADIFNLVYYKLKPRVEIIASTQYGKSDVVGMAIDYRMYTHREPFAIVAGQKAKSQIIMDRVIQHLFDQPKFYNLLELDSQMTLDRLRRERSRDNITLKTGGSVRTFTAGTSSGKYLDTALTGFGSPNIIEDEASLIDDPYQAMIMRMLGGHSTKDTFLCKIGNPFRRNHFFRTWNSERYFKLLIDYHQGIREGRYSEDFIDEVRAEPFFDVLYECQFPAENELLDGGYRRLLTSAHIELAVVHALPAIAKLDSPRLGVDIARGGKNQSVYTLRWPISNFAQVLEKNNDPNLMNQVAKIKAYKKLYKIGDYHIGVDDAGVGGGVSDRLEEEDVLIIPVQEGAAANNKQRYANQRAELYWEARKWVLAGGKLMTDPDWDELTEIAYRQNSSSKLQMQPKADMLKRGIQSPDTADSFSLTFVDASEAVDEDDIDIL